MEKLKLVPETDPALTIKSKDWDWTTDGDIVDLTRKMIDIMLDHNGIGLAAPQIGVNKRVLVMGTREETYICINPEVVDTSGAKKDIEGCLSFPGLWLHVSRPESVSARYQTQDGSWTEKIFTDLYARVFLHEYDHLNGVRFTDRVGSLSLSLAQKRRGKAAKLKNHK